MSNNLVVYFSRAGENYSNGKIVCLEKGNTAIAAEMIAEYANAELFELIRMDDYPTDYNECVAEAKKELEENARPTLREYISAESYDNVFVGYPSWCSSVPMPVCSYFESQDFTDKNILPFCTNEGSGLGKSIEYLESVIPTANFKKGLSIKGSDVNESCDIIKDWVERSL